MVSYFVQLTIGAIPVQIDLTKLPQGQGASFAVNKIFVQHAPGNTGNFRVGRTPNLTLNNATPGIWVASTASTNPDGTNQPGGSWGVQSSSKSNDVAVNQFYFHGTHSGDVLNIELSVQN